MFIFISITLRESFSQCLLFNEIKSATSETLYNTAIEYDGYYYMAGAGINDTNELNYNSSFNALIVKSDYCGRTIWKKFFSKNLNSGIDNTIINIIAHNGFIYAIGQTAEQAAQGTDFIVKINLDGDVVWYKIFRTNNNDITGSKFFIYKNSIIVYGYHEQREKRPPLNNNYIMCIDTSGNLVWEKEHFKNNGVSEYVNIFPSGSNQFTGISAVSQNFKYGIDSILYDGVMVCGLDSDFNILNMDTLKRGFNIKTSTNAYNSQTKKILIHLNKWISTDSIFCQIAILDNKGKLDRLIDDSYYIPSCIVTFNNGWIRNYTTSLIEYDSLYIIKRKFITNFSNEKCYFESKHLSLTDNGNLLLAGYSNACNPYDYNPNSHYNRPTAFVVDTNFLDYGKALPPPIKYNVIKAFPNPALESITLQITETAAEYSIYNSMGMFISSGNMQSSAEISLINMASGMYIIQLKTPQGNHIGNVKFLKK